MKELKKHELLNIYGGIEISGSFLNSLVRIVDIALEVGRSLGTAIRRIGGKNICGVR